MSPADPLAQLPPVLTVDEAAALLRIGRNQAYEAVRRGDLPSLKLGRSIRIPRAALARLLDPDPEEPAADDPPHALRAV